MDFKVIKKLNDAIQANREKLQKETDNNKRKILRLKINIDEIKVRMQRQK